MAVFMYSLDNTRDDNNVKFLLWEIPLVLPRADRHMFAVSYMYSNQLVLIVHV